MSLENKTAPSQLLCGGSGSRLWPIDWFGLLKLHVPLVGKNGLSILTSGMVAGDDSGPTSVPSFTVEERRRLTVAPLCAGAIQAPLFSRSLHG